MLRVEQRGGAAGPAAANRQANVDRARAHVNAVKRTALQIVCKTLVVRLRGIRASHCHL